MYCLFEVLTIPGILVPGPNRLEKQNCPHTHTLEKLTPLRHTHTHTHTHTRPAAQWSPLTCLPDSHSALGTPKMCVLVLETVLGRRAGLWAARRQHQAEI
jgi:hypothetical protein